VTARDENTEPRRPHTLYLTDATWQELERRYLEQRLAGGDLTKIAFAEEVLRSGLTAHAGATSRRTVTTARRMPSGRAPELEAGATDEPASEAQRPQERTERPPSPPRPIDPPPAKAGERPPTAPPRAPKRGALARLREASDPGRPPVIPSAAPVQTPPPDADRSSTG
jgi:hypothetical protein